MENLLIPYQSVNCIPAQCALVLAPHPDDEVFGCAGAIMRHLGHGADVRVIVVSDGGYGVAEAERANYVQLRERESIAAAGVLGYGQPQFWNYRDREVLYGEKLVIQIIEAIKAVDADLVYAPSVLEMHPDHRNLAMAAVEAVRRMNTGVRIAMYEVGIPLHPNLLLDITELVGRKKSAMECFSSQIEKQRYDLEIAALNRYRSYTLPAEVTDAEAYAIFKAEELSEDPLKLYRSEYARQDKLGLKLDIQDAPLVSVIVRSMDRPMLSDALDSIALQTYPNIEVVLVNAKGAAHRKIEQWCGRFPLRMIGNNTPLSRGRAANCGLDAARGEYLIFLDDDDWFEADHIQKLADAIRLYSTFKVVYTGVKCVDEKNNPLADTFAYPFDATRLLAENFIPIHAALFSRTLLELGCRVDESFDMYEDWDFWIQLSRFTDFWFVNEMSAVYRINRQSGSGVHIDHSRREAALRTLYKKWLGELSDDQVVNLMQPIRQIPQKDKQITSLQQAVADLNQAVTERDVQVTGLNQAVAERDKQIADLNQVVTERDEQVAGLNHAVADRDMQLAGLNQVVAERDMQVVGLNQAVAERDKQMADLNQVVAERDVRVASLNQDVSKYQEIIAALGQIAVERDAAKAHVQELLHSRSWRLTAPLRGLGRLVRRMSQPSAHCGFFSRAVMAACVFPATFFHYSGLGAWLAAIGRGRSFFGAVLNNPATSRTRLNGQPRLVRVAVTVCLSVALSIRKNGGVLPPLLYMYRIYSSKGLRGVYARLMERAPVRDVAVVGEPVKVIDKTVDLRRILVADYRIPMQDVSSGERGTVGILRDLCLLGYEVVFLPNDLLPSPKYEAELEALGVTVITTAQGYHSSLDYLRAEGHTFGAFHLFRVDVAERMVDVVRQVAPSAIIIFHTVDLHFLREMREAELHQDSVARAKAELTRERELTIMQRVDQVILVSSAEVPILKKYLPHTLISVFPALYAPIAIDPEPFDARRNIFFLGGFAHKPNVDAVQWFTAEIWPLVSIQLPGVEFHIVGSEVPQQVQDLERIAGVKVVGFVQDLEPLLASMRVGVAPLRFGAGIKGKVAMILGAGVPCVCTGIAAEGMHIRNGVHTLVEDEPQAYANAVIALYNNEDLWTKFSANGQNLIRRNFGFEANRSSLLSLLNAVRALPISLFIEYCTALSPRAVPTPPEGGDVDVSIIVPVYNQWAFTQACLNSILESSLGDGVCFEIILADDGSSDETVRAAELYPGLKVIKTPQNVGFLRNCNHAAKYARGKHILLLNNDTVVLPGWLTALYQLIEEDESAAIVGSKLLYPDATIQEAGAVLWNDGTASNCGRYLERDTSQYMRMREVDYVSGASFLIRKSFWESVGGFDERYKNAYCEDCDLAITARAKGMRVLYQPLSEVIHFEHQTYTGERTEYLLPVQRENIQRLCDKWRDVFASTHLPPGTPVLLGMANAERSPSPSTLAHRRQGRLNILYFSPFPSHPSNHGNRAFINQLARQFQTQGHVVHFVLLQGSDYTENDVDAMRATWDTLDVLPNSHPLGADGNPIPFDGWYEEGLGERISCLCAQYDIDVVFCSYVFQSKLLEFVPAHMLKVIDTHDKMGNRYDMLRKNGQPLEFFSCTPEEEGAYLRRADVVVALREAEARYFDSVTGRHTAVVISHAEAPRFVSRDFTNVRHVGTVASANRINLTLVRECLEAIARRLQGAECPFTVHIAGQVKEMVEQHLSAKEKAVFSKPWVHLHGFVQDIGEFYAGMDLILSPVTMGTGINVKTVQAMAYGMPLLTTECGSKGIETGDPMHTHTDLDALASSLFSIVEHPADLRRLAALSRDRYIRLYDDNERAITALFVHPKLIKADKGAVSMGAGSIDI